MIVFFGCIRSRRRTDDCNRGYATDRNEKDNFIPTSHSGQENQEAQEQKLKG